MDRKRLIALIAGLLAAFPAAAQFFSLGADPGGLRWNTIETPTYRLVYPRGLDSLARAYAVTLEQAAGPVSGSIGLVPNAAYRNRMPVILHPFTTYANGQVTWTPRRMDLLTVPDISPDNPTPWTLQLSIHESRHAAQMQGVAGKPFRWLGVLTGQLGAGGLAAVYAGPALFEGDAVVAETALTIGGRGRAADFLEYYRVSFAAGDFRDFYRWRYGSQRRYTPDYYRAGYIAVGGIRAHYGVPDLTARFYRRLADHGGFAFFNWDKTVREATGKSFKEAFAEVCGELQDYWAADEAARAPFTDSRAVTPVPRRFTEYTGLEGVPGGILAVKNGLTTPDALVFVAPDGQERRLALLGTGVCSPQYDETGGRYFWSEVVRDSRWPLRSWSVIRSSGGKEIRTLTRRSRYFEPAPAGDGKRLAVVEYDVDGSSRVVLLDQDSGAKLRSWEAPDGMQLVELVWVDGELYVSAITDEGSGLYHVDSDYSPVLKTGPVEIQQPWNLRGRLAFACDLSGVDELYALSLQDGTVERLTTTRFGASDFTAVDDTLYFSSLQQEGRLVRKVALDDLHGVKADFSVRTHYPFVDELVAGEPLPLDTTAPVEVSEPKPYSKLAHLFRFHSWAPLYIAFDSLDDLSFAALQQTAGLGATAFFQNDLGTASGFFGYHAEPENGKWTHSLHGTFNYTGLYPVIELSVDWGDREALGYFLETDEKEKTTTLKTNPLGKASLSGTLRTYIPWNFSSGGWQRGLVPTATLLFNNDRFETGSPMHRTTFSLRAYTMMRTPDSCVYPRFGIGAELGYSFRWTPGLLAPSGYAYLYGYLPGLHETHGLRWSALASKRFDGTFSEAFASMAPRGFTDAVTRRMAAWPFQFKAALDYKMPLIPVDRALLGPVAYLRNFELTLHGDLSTFSAPSRSGGTLFSAGADLVAVLGNLLWIPYPTRIGVSYNYNGGSAYNGLAALELPLRQHVFSLVFSVEM